jgi:ABC-type multidrug transport system fused ATPase/permease subunit
LASADVDRILLLQDGVVKEYGKPKELLQDQTSAFRELCRQSNELEELERLAGIHKQ